ncbi:MAG TPA: ribonuclease R [Bacteroidia bacterium]|nr:ribonuclease R [Bacteroidia bacterium]
MSKKKQKLGKHLLVDDVISVLSKNKGKPLNYKQIAAQLHIEDHSQKILINTILEDLTERQTITEPQRGKFLMKSSDRFIIGKVDMTSSGDAYIVSDETEEDVFVSAKKTLRAFHGDTVKVRVRPSKANKKADGEIVEIIERSKTAFVGIVKISPRFAFFIADNSRMQTDIFIPLESLNGAKDGQKAIAKIVEWSEKDRNPIGEITEVLGDAGDHETEMHAILAEFGLPYRFPKEVEKMADKIPTFITENEISNRKDFRQITTFTIDPIDAKDFDDALSLRKMENGNWEIGVHIADVSHYVKPDSIVDTEASARATSVYLVDRVVPMLPEILSNNVCSLRPKEDKLCFSAVFELTENADVLTEWFGRTIINSDRRFTYEEVQLILETEQGEFVEELKTLDTLAKKLRAERFKKGAIAFDRQEVKFNLDEKGNPTGVFFKEQKDAHKLIEDFMLLANRKVAEYVGKRKTNKQKTFVYRVHDAPDPEKLQNFSNFVTRFGYKLNTKSAKEITTSMNKLLHDAKSKPEENIIEQLAIRTMSKAIYTTQNIGHYGLAFDYYTHFTSPIRRYPDVMAHRLLQRYLDEAAEIKVPPINDNKLEEECKHSSAMEKLAADAERASVKYKQVEFLEDKIGQKFDGIISGVTEWGMFIEIIENKCEGMIRLRDLKDDFYFFDEENYCIKGRRSGKKYSLGDKLKIVVKRADLVKKQLDFGLAGKSYDY